MAGIERKRAVGPIPLTASCNRHILDFARPALKLAIELDGGQHAQGNAVQRDELRSAELAQHGYRVVRFWNDVLSNIGGVMDAIRREIDLGPTPPHPPHR